MMQNHGGVMPEWRERAVALSGYGGGLRMTVGEVQEVRLVSMVYRALLSQAGSQGCMEPGKVGEALWVEVWHQQGAWGSVKKAAEFKGPGGMALFWRCIAMLMLEGRIEGHVGRGPREGDWWSKAVEVWDRMGIGTGDQGDGAGAVEGAHFLGVIPAIRQGGAQQQRRQLGEEGVARVYLDWCSGAQSARPAAEEGGYIYRGGDIRRHVYSAREKRWVENLPVDLMKGTFAGIWEVVQRSVEQEVGEGVKVVLGFVGGGPCCITFSRMNRVNEERGCAYRDRDGNPVEGHYGELAKKGDKDVMRLQRFLRWAGRKAEFKGWFGGWMLENPVGDLARRDYMEGWELDHVRREVDLCAYGHYYRKPTHIWTSVMGWTPRGETGDGRCGSKCGAGYWGEKGRWVHRHALGVASQRAKAGKGRKEMKQAIPHLLHREVLEAVRW